MPEDLIKLTPVIIIMKFLAYWPGEPEGECPGKIECEGRSLLLRYFPDPESEGVTVQILGLDCGENETGEYPDHWNRIVEDPKRMQGRFFRRRSGRNQGSIQ